MVTQDVRRVGVPAPTHIDRSETIAAYLTATTRLQALMTELGIDEDEIVAEFDAARRARRATVAGAGRGD